MNHTDHMNLLRGGIPMPGGVWADLGSGAGAFTLALAELLGPTGEIYSVDKDAGALREQARTMRAQFPQTTVHYQTTDFTRPLKLPALDGIVMANSLHFQRHQATVLQTVFGYLRPGGRLLIVEYNIDKGNFAVPYPVPYPAWEKLAQEVGFTNTHLLMTRPSRFLHEIYSAASW
ncbi:MAG: methyltransferase domain-containing protein [Chloroflexi bacterium]|nr:methyltransferase domain-containing protein [Chloroflexota bacterium]